MFFCFEFFWLNKNVLFWVVLVLFGVSLLFWVVLVWCSFFWFGIGDSFWGAEGGVVVETGRRRPGDFFCSKW